MKLNNNGWGYRDMIIYTSIILIALIFVTLSISSFYDGIVNADYGNDTYTPTGSYVDKDEKEESMLNENNSNVINTDYYTWLETKLKSATLDYLNTYSYDISDNIMNVSLDTLVSFGFIERLYDQSGTNMCSGYSNVFLTNDGMYEIKPYISCSNYVTNGY